MIWLTSDYTHDLIYIWL